MAGAHPGWGKTSVASCHVAFVAGRETAASLVGARYSISSEVTH